MPSIIAIEVELSAKEYYQTHLSITNIFIPIKATAKEIEVLASFMSLEGDISDDRFGTTARKMVKEKLGISDAGLSNYLKALINKGFLIQDGRNLHLNQLLVAMPTQQDYQFRLVNKEIQPILSPSPVVGVS